jgi:hypothetical protein
MKAYISQRTMNEVGTPGGSGGVGGSPPLNSEIYQDLLRLYQCCSLSLFSLMNWEEEVQDQAELEGGGVATTVDGEKKDSNDKPIEAVEEKQQQQPKKKANELCHYWSLLLDDMKGILEDANHYNRLYKSYPLTIAEFNLQQELTSSFCLNSSKDSGGASLVSSSLFHGFDVASYMKFFSALSSSSASSSKNDNIHHLDSSIGNGSGMMIFDIEGTSFFYPSKQLFYQLRNRYLEEKAGVLTIAMPSDLFSLPSLSGQSITGNENGIMKHFIMMKASQSLEGKAGNDNERNIINVSNDGNGDSLSSTTTSASIKRHHFVEFEKLITSSRISSSSASATSSVTLAVATGGEYYDDEISQMIPSLIADQMKLKPFDGIRKPFGLYIGWIGSLPSFHHHSASSSASSTHTSPSSQTGINVSSTGGGVAASHLSQQHQQQSTLSVAPSLMGGMGGGRPAGNGQLTPSGGSQSHQQYQWNQLTQQQQQQMLMKQQQQQQLAYQQQQSQLQSPKVVSPFTPSSSGGGGGGGGAVPPAGSRLSGVYQQQQQSAGLQGSSSSSYFDSTNSYEITLPRGNNNNSSSIGNLTEENLAHLRSGGGGAGVGGGEGISNKNSGYPMIPLSEMRINTSDLTNAGGKVLRYPFRSPMASSSTAVAMNNAVTPRQQLSMNSLMMMQQSVPESSSVDTVVGHGDSLMPEVGGGGSGGGVSGGGIAAGGGSDRSLTSMASALDMMKQFDLNSSTGTGSSFETPEDLEILQAQQEIFRLQQKIKELSQKKLFRLQQQQGGAGMGIGTMKGASDKESSSSFMMSSPVPSNTSNKVANDFDGVTSNYQG